MSKGVINLLNGGKYSPTARRMKIASSGTANGTARAPVAEEEHLGLEQCFSTRVPWKK